ncbi:four-carbon acid sugar kinase family protein [Agriterribacter sp.]|uniref:four-carbon acid sugar kinase family protein n=1 Tax=Agriterribacter sp. TaxID=2821509 RepID=UPI002C93AFD9|nr:four-carbon acid sugar kinase family protein [Agriterribacter sp.]HRO45639.1 four-carbon acid sugar kinase family protein [Agriterribacter sp.]HRQ17460.1 four-carbon acid sugar kinase family protein [Agriterribacter sp.]
MIAVIADDFTGAAEIGGIGIRFQMKVEIVTRVSIEPDTDLLIIVTDTRSKSAEEAINDIYLITCQLMKLKPELIYKKIDSVLRGHIIAELLAQMKIMGKQRALAVPANPHLGRVIKDGMYYLKDVRLHETGFRNDPEFVMSNSDTMRSSDVIDILRYNNSADLERLNIIVAKTDVPFPAKGIIIGEALSSDDLRLWAKRVDDHTLIAGASSFFLALLEHLQYPHREGAFEKSIAYSGGNMLLVCGSSFSKSKQMVAKVLADGAPVSLMPSALLHADGALLSGLQDQWASDIISLFATHNHVIVAADPEANYPANELGRNISKHIAKVVGKVMKRLPVQELMLEGGSTASSILNEMHLEKLYPQQELADGVIRTSVPGNAALHITFKPGSYRWPESIWNSNLRK